MTGSFRNSCDVYSFNDGSVVNPTLSMLVCQHGKMRSLNNVDDDDWDLDSDDHSFLPNGHQAVWSPANDKPKDKHCNIDKRKYNFNIIKFQLQYRQWEKMKAISNAVQSCPLKLTGCIHQDYSARGRSAWA